jgi:hypothetical protein
MLRNIRRQDTLFLGVQSSHLGLASGINKLILKINLLGQNPIDRKPRK